MEENGDEVKKTFKIYFLRNKKQKLCELSIK